MIAVLVGVPMMAVNWGCGNVSVVDAVVMFAKLFAVAAIRGHGC